MTKSTCITAAAIAVSVVPSVLAAISLDCPVISSGGTASAAGTFIVGQVAVGTASSDGLAVQLGVIGCWECEGDVNGDGAVDPLDTGFVLSRFGCHYPQDGENCLRADLNGDGSVDPLDAGYVLSRFGTCD